MSKLLTLLFLFSSGSMFGWVLEVFFRRFLDPVDRKKKKWINPGFLTGPSLPIYGTGLIVLYLLAQIRIPQLEAEHPVIEKLIIFLIMALCMTLIEFITGLIFINKMHLQLWDYSDRPGNIKGIICPAFSIIWYALAAFYYMILHPEVEKSLDWLSRNLAFSFFIGAFYGIFVIDLVYSLQVVVKIKEMADEYGIVVKYNAYKSKLADIKNEYKEKGQFFFATAISSISHKEIFANYREHFSVKRIVQPIQKVASKVADRVDSDVIKTKEERREDIQ